MSPASTVRTGQCCDGQETILPCQRMTVTKHSESVGYVRLIGKKLKRKYAAHALRRPECDVAMKAPVRRASCRAARRPTGIVSRRDLRSNSRSPDALRLVRQSGSVDFPADSKVLSIGREGIVRAEPCP